MPEAPDAHQVKRNNIQGIRPRVTRVFNVKTGVCFLYPSRCTPYGRKSVINETRGLKREGKRDTRPLSATQRKKNARLSLGEPVKLVWKGVNRALEPPTDEMEHHNLQSHDPRLSMTSSPSLEIASLHSANRIPPSPCSPPPSTTLKQASQRIG